MRGFCPKCVRLVPLAPKCRYLPCAMARIKAWISKIRYEKRLESTLQEYLKWEEDFYGGKCLSIATVDMEDEPSPTISDSMLRIIQHYKKEKIPMDWGDLDPEKRPPKGSIKMIIKHYPKRKEVFIRSHTQLTHLATYANSDDISIDLMKERWNRLKRFAKLNNRGI